MTPAGPTIEGDKVAITCEDGFQLDTKTPDAATCVATWKGGEYDRTGSVCVAACGAYPPVQVKPNPETRELENRNQKPYKRNTKQEARSPAP